MQLSCYCLHTVQELKTQQKRNDSFKIENKIDNILIQILTVSDFKTENNKNSKLCLGYIH